MHLVRRSRSAQSWGSPVDTAVAAALTVAVLVGLILRRDPAPVDFLVGPLLTSTVAWRRWSPQGAAAVGLVAALVLHDTDPLAQSLLIPVVVVLVYYMLGRRSERARRPLDGVLLVVVLPAIWLTPGDSQPVALLSVWVFFFVLPYLTGRHIASRSAAALVLEREAAQAELAQRDDASRAIALERIRVARDLHDVVAHDVSVMAIQAVAARRTAASDPETAREALAAVASCGRDALVEMRRMIGALRRNDLDLASAWEPGLDQVHVLADRARLAGVEVTVRISGTASALPPAQDLVAFRVLQEALTNVVKHAGPTHVDVAVRYGPSSVEIRVDDEGAGSGARVPVVDGRGGQGLVGMRERLALYGGTLSAEPGRQGGFAVRATLPLDGRG